MVDPPSQQPLKLSEALALGALHGPAELLPISSSGHLTIIPWLLGWDYVEVDPEVRKAFEVALHAGTALALVIGLRDEVQAAVSSAGWRLAMLVGLSCAPPAVVGWAFEDVVERRLGRPGPIAVGLVVGGLAMGWADRTAQVRGSEEASWADALWLGVAQACALMPGVSRGGATLTAARWRRFRRADASRLSRHIALPVIGGAALLMSRRLMASGLPASGQLGLAAGAGAAFASTLGSTWLVGQVERDRPLLPFVIYRVGLGALVLRRLRPRDR